MLVLVTLCVLVLLWWMSRPKNNPGCAPGPRPWPIIGSLHLLDKYKTPFQVFTELSKLYGDVFSIDLGTSRCVVVNNFKLIKEVLIAKGADFGGRPDFIRFHKLFGGDRNNCKYPFFLPSNPLFLSILSSLITLILSFAPRRLTY